MEQHLYAKLCARVLVSCLIWIIWSPNLTGQCLGFEFGEIECPEICVCRDNKGFDVDCTARNLTKIPTGINEDVVKLELSMNNLTSIPDFTFKKFRKLESLYLVGNSLTTLSSNVFNGLVRLTSLFLQDNKFKEVPRDALRSLPSLQTLYLDANDIEVVPPDSFQGMHNLKQLRLDANRITEIPVAALNHARNLGAIHLGLNQISRIPDYAFRNLNNLIVLMLSANVISEVGDHAFEGLPVLHYLELNKNLLGNVPAALISLPDLVDLNIAENRIQHLENDTFNGNRKLETVDLKDNPIRSIAINAFSNLPELKELMISEAREQTVFPSLAGTSGLDKIIFDRAAITALPGDLCTNMDKLKVLDVHSNKITEIPDMSGCTELTLLNLGHNQIATLREGQFDGLFNLKDLILNNNLIDGIPALVFLGLSKLIYLDLSFNRIRYIDEMAFATVTELTDLNLSDNRFSYLPTKGLSNLKQLKTFHNKELIEPPPYDALPKIQTLALAYAYHCCEFVKKGNGVKKEPLAVQEKVEWTKGNSTEGLWRFKENETYDIHDPDMDWLQPFWDEDYYENNTEMSLVLQVEDIMLARPPVDCRPLPGPFLPCDDLFGWWSLRCGVWIVFLLAVLGNGAVLFVSITSRSKMDVPRFLICNLACSDFFMGIYLGFLAIVDASTLGEFKKYAVQWQLSSGCLVAGFLGVLSSELSVFTLCVITLERLYAISNAIQLSKRMSLKQAGCIMLCGWLFAIAVASLPLFDISDYKKFAICLPFEKETAVSLGYVCFIMIFNAVTFCIIVISYIVMYVSIRGAQTWNSTDSRMAKRMALLVFTDFFCWAPIIFFSITAAFESNLARISLDEAKVLTIFVLPLNSCANPFLYAFFTRQFKRDCVKLCKRIEESNFSRHFSSSVNRRVSLSSNRGPSHLNSSFTVEKIGSCSRSLSNGSTSGEVNNEREMAKETDLRRAEITDASDVLQYVRSDSGICMGDGRTIQLDDSSPISDRPKTLKLPTTLDFDNQEGYSRLDSTPNIVLHTDEGEIYLCAPSKIQNETECKIPLIPAERSTQVQRGENNIGSNSKYTKGLGNEIPKRPSSKTEIDFGNQINSVKKRVKRTRSSVKDSDKPQNKHKMISVNPRSRRENCSTATQTDSEIKLRDRPVIQNLPGAINSSDRNKVINEWRKTSHLSFLWRNSQDFDPFLPQQKSNSLVELTRQIRDWGDSSCKRHSLSSRHEGYILLKNSSRDSAYDEDDLYEFHNKSLCIPSTKSKTVNASDIQETCLCMRGDSDERIDSSWHHPQHPQPLGNDYVDQYSFRTTALLESVSSDEDDEGFRIERNNETVDKESGVRFDS
ncbi:hypothetical protein ACJMK2_019653 [Sinanodonta woodiana]|uniref:G-protein coupled receptors family 1 profile domain-containing protein n=1 Tax=Sinanodonta woodiana TaxID=1069815 RepID=A0ABD3TWW3_SINWO